MIPIGDENPTLRTPWATYLLLGSLAGVWFVVQGAGAGLELLRSVCNLGMVAGELTGLAQVGLAVPLGAVETPTGIQAMACVVDREAINLWTPLTSMFLHGGWMHLLGNALYLWVFGNNVEDSMGRARFLIFYLLCGLAAAGVQLLTDPASPVPMVGASGAIAGVLGAYLLLYPRVYVRMLFFVFVLPIPAWAVLIFWFGTQLLSGMPQLSPVDAEVSDGVAYWAHIGGFLAGLILVKFFENPDFKHERDRLRHVLHPGHP